MEHDTRNLDRYENWLRKHEQIDEHDPHFALLEESLRKENDICWLAVSAAMASGFVLGLVTMMMVGL